MHSVFLHIILLSLFCYRVYDIGIDVRFGQGRYRETRIVTLATRYQLENRTQHTLAFSQRHFVREHVCISSVISFHFLFLSVEYICCGSVVLLAVAQFGVLLCSSIW